MDEVLGLLSGQTMPALDDGTRGKVLYSHGVVVDFATEERRLAQSPMSLRRGVVGNVGAVRGHRALRQGRGLCQDRRPDFGGERGGKGGDHRL